MQNIEQLIKAKGYNIFFAGRVGAGKTTSLNALILELAMIPSHTRSVIIEDTPELQGSIENNVTI
jgi:type IV secretory pathway ATPase VirB11/archaellum biosynthesis ATPase